MRFAWAVSLAVVVAQVAVAEPWDLPPPPRGEWMVDRTGKTSATTRFTVNRRASELDASGSGQLGVLVLDTTSGVNPRDFATGVFNSWGVGHHDTNDGILLFIAVNDRRAEIIRGDGSKVTQAQTDGVMRDQVVANMKRGDLDAAVVEACNRLDVVMRHAVGDAPRPHPKDNSGIGPDAYTTPQVDVSRVDPKLGPYADGSKPFAERSPRSWVIDLSEVLTPPERARLDVAASDVYASNQGRTFFLVYRSHALFPRVEELAQRLRRQVEPLSKLGVAIIAVDVDGASTIDLPAGILDGPWENEKHAEAEQRLRDFTTGDRMERLLHAQAFAQRALTRTITPRSMSEVLDTGIREHQAALQFSGGGVLLGFMLWLRRWNRRRPRTCEACGHPRQLLGEDAEDTHLTSSQQVEERIKSVDWDVWWCGRCKDVLVLRYGAWFSGYSDCPECNSKTKSSTSTTLRSATEYSEGEEQIDEQCANCSYRNSYTRTTARLSSSDSSSSSSSSSSSFGGGSSSGGGSSGSW